VVAAGLTFVLTFEFLRAWAVSMPLFYDGNLHLSPPLQGLVAFSSFVVAFIAAGVFRRWRRPLRSMVLLAAGTRIALQFIGPGLPRLVVVLVGLAACLSLLVAIAPRRHTVLALVGALAADAVLLMALQTESLVFRNGVGPAAGMVAMCAAFVTTHWLSVDLRTPHPAGAPSQLALPRDALLPWLAFGPALALHLTVASLPAPVEVATGWDPAAARVLIAGSYVVGAILAFWGLGRTPKRRSGRFLPTLAAAVILGCSFVALFAGSGRWSVVAAVLLPIGLLAGLASLARLPGSTGDFQVRLASAGALTLGVGVPMLFYLGFVFRYPVVPAWLLAATACVLAGLLALVGIFNRPVDQLSALEARGMESTPAIAPSPPALGRPEVPPLLLPARSGWVTGLALVVALITFLIAAPALGGGSSTDRSALNGFPVRVASYNIFMGLGADVNMDLDRLAQQMASQKPDVIALQEVSRGWFTSGSVDLLPRLAERLGYSYRFFPAANQTWGNAILTNLPAADYAHGFLPQGIAAMRRGWGAEVLDLGKEQRLLFVVTHLYNPLQGHELRAAQAEALVDRTVAMAEQYHLVDMTVLVGDLNAESDSPELSSLRDAYTDVFGYLGSAPTYPSWAPDQRIDHMFASAGLHGSDAATFGGLASDHLGIAVTLRPSGPAGQPGEQ
jgi:endonuclease/exonuclease/phosphatase family metal-dependent hydrolase